jgi:hypothetical protein
MIELPTYELAKGNMNMLVVKDGDSFKRRDVIRSSAIFF